MTAISHQLSRRAFVRNGSLFLLGTAATRLEAADEQQQKVRVGLITDLHHADKPTRGSRHYRDTLGKLAEAAKQFTTDRPDFIVELGDFIDAAESVETEQGYLRQVSEVFDTIPGPKHYVLGNHCVDTLTKEEFLSGVGKKQSFYSFDVGGFHFIVLDSCFRSDGKPYGRKNSTWTDANIPAQELDWLQADLKDNAKPVIVFAHQRLDDAGQHAVKNAADVRKILESGKVKAVFQGHSHKNDHQEISGIHYCTLVAMVKEPGQTTTGIRRWTCLKTARSAWQDAEAGELQLEVDVQTSWLRHLIRTLCYLFRFLSRLACRSSCIAALICSAANSSRVWPVLTRSVTVPLC